MQVFILLFDKKQRWDILTAWDARRVATSSIILSHGYKKKNIYFFIKLSSCTIRNLDSQSKTRTETFADLTVRDFQKHRIGVLSVRIYQQNLQKTNTLSPTIFFGRELRLQYKNNL